jgi:hypothetical protein
MIKRQMYGRAGFDLLLASASSCTLRNQDHKIRGRAIFGERHQLFSCSRVGRLLDPD